MQDLRENYGTAPELAAVIGVSSYAVKVAHQRGQYERLPETIITPLGLIFRKDEPPEVIRARWVNNVDPRGARPALYGR